MGLMQTPLRHLLLNLKGHHWWLSLLLWIAMVAPAVALELRIAIQENAKQLVVGSSTEAVIRDGAGRNLGEIGGLQGYAAGCNQKGVKVSQWQSANLWVQPESNGSVYIGDRWYRGRVKLTKTNQGLTAVNYVDLEDYLASVVGKEMYPTWPPEALKAQAVAARTYALYKRQKPASSLFDMGNTVTWQVYDGVNGETASTRAAVEATAGQILTYQGRPIEAVFHASSGGHTENSEDVWSSAVPYLRGVQDFDQSAPVYQWIAGLRADQIKTKIPGIGNIQAFKPQKTTATGRIISMQVVGDSGSRTMSGNQLRKALNLKSSLFTVKPKFEPVASSGKVSARPTVFEISGRGYGHGLGMSQWGAYALAQQGYTYQQIVQHYYQGTSLTSSLP